MTEILTKSHKKKMASFLISIVNKFRTVNVAESLVDFTARKRVLTSGTSARPGPFRFSVTPYLREIAYELSDHSKTTELAVMKPTQWGFTDGVMMNHELYCIYYGIGPVLYVTSDDDTAKQHMEKRIDTMISASGMQEYITPSVKKKGNKATGDSLRAKSFKGTFLKVTGARSESKLSSIPIRILHLDEEDKYPLKLVGGGDSTEKAKRRTDSFKGLKKIVHGSTPKEKATSKIEPIFEQGDMRYYNFKCPKCGIMQRLLWSQIEWEKNEHGKMNLKFDDEGLLINNPVWHNCIDKECDYKMKDYEKVTILQEEGYGGSAKWIPTKKPDVPGLKSWKGHGLEGFRSWVDIVVQWEKIDGDPILLQDMVNDVFGETYTSKIDKPDEHYLMSRAETDWHRGQINERIKILTLGCDVQGNRIEYALMGWTDKRESWAVDYDIFTGDPNDPNDPLWDKLEEVLTKEYEKENGNSIRIQIALIDAPYSNEAVMAFCERFPYNPNSYQGVYPCFGKQTLSAIVKPHDSTISTPEILLDEQKLKREIYNNLKRKVPTSGANFPTGYIHFPEDYSEDYYKQLTAEEVIETIDNKGISTLFISNTKQKRNEVLDCTKMALGGLYYSYITYFKLINKNRKARKKKEIPIDWTYFWALHDEVL